MNEYKFGVTGKDRKALVTAISEILNTPSVYLKTPTYAYKVGSFINIDRDGAVTGEMTADLLTALAERGFVPEQTEETPDTTDSQPDAETETPAEPERAFTFDTPRGNFKIRARYDTVEEAQEAGYSNYFHHDGRDVYIKPSGNGEHCKHFAVVGAPFEKPEADTTDTTENQPEAEQETCTDPIAETAPETSEQETPAEAVAEPKAASNRLCIEVPLDGFTPESLDNLCKMVTAKEPLIKKALGADKLPIRVLNDRIAFDWFTTADNMDEYAQFITQLCKTAKEKKRVTAKAHESFENEKFAMRVWLIGLGLIGKQYLQIRKLMAKNLSGDAAFRYGKPEKADDKNTVAV